MEPSPTEGVLASRAAFRRGPDGRIEVRRWFGADGWALALSFLVPLAFLVLLVLGTWLLVSVLPTPDETSP